MSEQNDDGADILQQLQEMVRRVLDELDPDDADDRDRKFIRHYVRLYGHIARVLREYDDSKI